ncbi:MAG: 4-hydroxy-tetrahydrodipicolinate reductase [Candidatus Latescibacterota bacterium]
MKLVMNGALGRMGRSIIALAIQDPEIKVTGAIECVISEKPGIDVGEIIGIGKLGISITDNLEAAAKQADVVIDFTWPDIILKTAEICSGTGTPLVIGTTGLPREKYSELKRIVSPIPCVMAPNMSVGVNLLFKLVADAASVLGDDYDVEITEVHHRFKKDAPSGTANRLAEIIAETLKRNLDTDAVYGRHGVIGERTRREIGIHALRIGDVVGEHTVSFGTIGERIELSHKAQSRDPLARGALRAAKFVVNARPGLYDMQDVLGLK